MMPTFSKWIKKAVDGFVDPEKEERINRLASVIQQGLYKQQKNFSLTAALRGIEYKQQDLDAAKEKVFKGILEKGWQDGKLSSGQQHSVNWITTGLQLPQQKARAMNIEFARSHFASALADAMQDGVLEPHEEARLHEIASSVGSNVAEFARTFFRNEGEGFLRGVFLACVADNHLSQEEWNHLLETTQKLGITRDELLRAVEPQARQFVEHVLADAKEDGRLSNQEELTLTWLIENLGLSPQFRQYVVAEVSFLRLVTQIQDGHLPSVAPPSGFGTKAGEIVHFCCPAIWRQVRMFKSGPRVDDHRGNIMLTDNRVVFASQTKSQTFNYRKIIAHQSYLDRIEIQVHGKPVNTFFLPDTSPIPSAIFRSAVAMANQTKVAKNLGIPTRHIPRDVRQRVWQRYGGRCAECNADDYLEFDHIVPFAKGGSNSDANVQLLCRRCNLKKSDHI